MAKDTKPETPSVPVDALAEAFQKALEGVAPPKPFDYSEYLQRPENQDPADSLKTPVLQHMQPLSIKGASDDLIRHLNELEPGKYIGGRVTVELIGRPPHQKFNITYPWQSMNDRMRNQNLFTSFSDLLQKINAEQKAKASQS